MTSTATKWPLVALSVLACQPSGVDSTDDTTLTTTMVPPPTVPDPTVDTTADLPTTDTTADPSTTAPPTTGTTDQPNFDVGTTPDNPVERLCSADLHAVVDNADQVIETCPPDQGCKAGQCVPACESAAATQASFGCDFQVATPPTWGQLTQPPCFAVFVTNSWGHPAQLTVSRGDTVFDLATFARVVDNGEPAQWQPIPAEGLDAGKVAVLFLSSFPEAKHPQTGGDLDCPVPDAVGAPSQVDAAGIGEAFHVTSTIPLTAYDMAPFGGAPSYIPSAELLFPTTAWGTNYVAIVPPAGDYSMPGPLYLQIVGQKDGTMVKIRPAADLDGGGALDPAPAGMVTDFIVDAGEYLQWQYLEAAGDASGTIIESSEPVALHTGNRFLRLENVDQPGGEATHQQISPVSALGFEYLAAPYATRRADDAPEDIDYRFVGAVDGTTLEYDPPIAGAPATLDEGQVVDFETPLAFRVRSQGETHPFLVAQLMATANIPGGTKPGATAPGFAMNLGDEEFVVLLPPAQFLQEYIFFTDPSYATTNLVLTRIDTGDGFADVTVDCLGVINEWQDVGTDGVYQVATVDLVRAEIGVGACTNGLQLASSTGPFGVVVWGMDSYSSYAYPAGGNAIPLSDIMIPPG